MNRTKIEWVKNPDGTPGYTCNPITGCLNHINGLCKGGGFPCYAYRLANGRLKERYLANLDIALPHENPKEAFNDPFYPRFWINRVRENFGACTSGAKPKGIFVCDMGDLFGVGIPDEWTRRVLSHIGMSYYREHRFYLLTKQPQNLIKFSPFPDNCWVGQTLTGLEPDLLDRLRQFTNIKVAKKFISFEPLLKMLELQGTLVDNSGKFFKWSEVVNWVIIGALTYRGGVSGVYPHLTPMPYGKGDTLQPPIEWVEEIIQACRKASVPIFLKNNLEPIIKGRKLIQEMPK